MLQYRAGMENYLNATLRKLPFCLFRACLYTVEVIILIIFLFFFIFYVQKMTLTFNIYSVIDQLKHIWRVINKKTYLTIEKKISLLLPMLCIQWHKLHLKNRNFCCSQKLFVIASWW